MGRGKLKTSCYWQKGVELFLIGLLTNSPGKSTSNHNRQTFQAVFKTALKLKGNYHHHYHHFHNFTVLFQPQCGKIYKTQKNLVFDCSGPLSISTQTVRQLIVRLCTHVCQQATPPCHRPYTEQTLHLTPDLPDPDLQQFIPSLPSGPVVQCVI